MRKSEITKIEKHYYENKNHTVRNEFKIYSGTFYEIKTKSELNKGEKEFYKDNGKQVFHF